ATGQRREAVVGLEFDASAGLAGLVTHRQQPLYIVDAESHPRFARDVDRLGSYRVRGLLAAPMIQRGEVIGVIEVVNRLDESDFGEDDLKLVQVFATLAASATRN